ncbi:hypothetical protein HYW61_00740 [candidate division WWE3 bacterium]|nr:hypothetical protein [candidate division WWE3 bacterium]
MSKITARTALVVILVSLSIAFLLTRQSGGFSEKSALDQKAGRLGSLDITVLPANSSSFDVSFDTHSTDLDFDFASLMKLRDDLGNDYAAVSWSGGSGGYHISGKVTFPKVSGEAKEITLTIGDIEGESASFSWRL